MDTLTRELFCFPCVFSHYLLQICDSCSSVLYDEDGAFQEEKNWLVTNILQD